MFTCGPAFWRSESLGDAWDPGTDPFWSSVIYFNTYDGPNGGTPSVFCPDLSDYGQTQGGSGNAPLSTSSPIIGSSSVNVTNASGAGFVLYYPGAEGITGTQDHTWECVVDFAATQIYTDPAIVRFGADKSINWATDHCVLHFNHTSYPNVLTFWAYNYSTTVPLLIGTTNLIGAGVSHVGWCRIGNTWRLLCRGLVEDAETWSGSLSSTSLVRGVGGNNDATPDAMTGKFDLVRETVGVGRYAGAYTAPRGTP